MPTETYVEFAGLTAEAVVLIEGLRKSPTDTKSEILVRALTPLQKPIAPSGEQKLIDYKEGIRLPVGEKLYLFLSRPAKYAGKPDAEAEIRSDGFYMDGRRVEPSHGRPFQPAMKIVQKRKGHLSPTDGDTVSLSAIRKWCVLRDGKFKSLVELKDPALARTRGKKLDLSDLDLSDLEL
ncbi:MAG: hypothetical protein EOS51_15605 [Mesorhizobium sp.]|uniref:hypothetical protein n=1 Tax=unclassified Mesorhizobium TaxID=325217 RepID=UPI000FE97146|nr:MULTISPECIES: hypothetical protein [unclassified Mesorhizobium]RWC19169.1 MAG: hypothetical protein EOS51_15605 [Mesorhizobium sp.]TGT93896.1 hypothetical protein EN807_26990 [Mesorhizobium sp. M5C.F.Ca.ET.164.01.1.1]